jgi:hypothetical protein
VVFASDTPIHCSGLQEPSGDTALISITHVDHVIGIGYRFLFGRTACMTVEPSRATRGFRNRRHQNGI